MEWFSEQIDTRIKADDAAFEDSFARIADSILGTRLSAALNDDSTNAKNAVYEILRYYRIRPKDNVPAQITDINEQLEYILRPHGLMRRTVELTGKWYRDAVGPMLGVLKSGGIVALLPTGAGGYSIAEPATGKRIKINRKTVSLLETEAVCFYKPFPLKKLTVADLFRYIAENLSPQDLILFALITLVVTVIGLFEPRINAYLVGDVLKAGNETMLLAISAFFLGVILSKLLFDTVGNIVNAKIFTKIDLNVVSATMMRVLSLPAKFFKGFSSGELFSRASSMSTLCSMLISSLLSVGLSSLFSLLYVTQIFSFAPALVVPALVITCVTLALTVATTLIQQNISKRKMELTAKETGLNYATLTGIRKIKLAAAEKRFFARWAAVYSESSKLEYNPSRFLVLNGVITTAISLIGNIVLMQSAISEGLTAAQWAAFNSAYGMLSGAFISLSGIALTVARIKPVFEMVRPIMEATPEISEEKQVVTRLSGGIEINNLSFRYTDSQPMVLDDLSLSIRPGQYIAICGTTGCGKSTLIRCLLGFETPLKGAIYYDNRDITTLDLRSLRRKIGVVMQDGKLMQGDIFSNIVISAPHLKLADAWEAAELAGIADDIRAMPMGMNTILSEGTGGISGGQRQRLMIARAVAPKPKILIFDEATSALDNITQRQISEALDRLKCTRIVVAHRLSTIRHCDRIIVLDGGHIIEDGTYEQLIARDGFFAELVRRQQLDTGLPSAPAAEREQAADEEPADAGFVPARHAFEADAEG